MTHRRFGVKTTDSSHAHLIAPNVLGRDFQQDLPDRTWAADITYVPTEEGWLYLAAVIELCSRKVHGRPPAGGAVPGGFSHASFARIDYIARRKSTAGVVHGVTQTPERLMRASTISFVLGIAVLSALGSAATPATRPADSGSESPELFGHANRESIRELNVPAGSSPADLLHRLRQLDPAFQYVAEPGTWQDTRLPEIQLRDVTTTDVIQILSNLVPDLRIQPINGSVWVLSSRGRAPSAPATQLSAFGLSDPVERIGLKDAWDALGKDQDAPTAEQIAAGRKQALKEVLSLLESAVTQADPSFQPSLKLHEATEVLLVRGTGAQLTAVSQAIKALQTTEGMNDYERNYKHLADRYALVQSQVTDLKNLEKAMRRTLEAETAQVSRLQKENADLKRQLQPTPGKASGN